MTSFAFCQIAVVEVQIPNQCAIIKSRPVGCGLIPANERDERLPPKVFKMLSDQRHGRATHRPNSTSQGIENANFELKAGCVGEAIKRRSDNELGEPFSVRH